MERLVGFTADGASVNGVRKGSAQLLLRFLGPQAIWRTRSS